MMNIAKSKILQLTEKYATSSHINFIVRRIFFFFIIIGTMAMLFSFTSMPHKRLADEREDSVAQDEDSVVSVIAWFNKNDTMTYWINESTWDIRKGDTIKTAGINTKIMITVTDSTKKGYDMEYSFLDFKTDSVKDSWKQNLLNEALNKYKEAIKGTTIKFRTDIYGKIIKYDNLNEIKKQSKQLFMETIKEMSIIDSLAVAGIDLKTLLKDVDADRLVQGYIDELELMFKHHGTTYNIVSITNHSDATEDDYETDSYVSVSENNETYDYRIVVDVNKYIPKDDIKSIIEGVASAYLDEDKFNEVKEDMDENFDKQVSDDLLYNTYLSIDYFYDGWPKEIIKQEKRVIGKIGKLSQKYITWDCRNVRH